jgi:hypothetical protein
MHVAVAFGNDRNLPLVGHRFDRDLNKEDNEEAANDKRPSLYRSLVIADFRARLVAWQFPIGRIEATGNSYL